MNLDGSNMIKVTEQGVHSFNIDTDALYYVYRDALGNFENTSIYKSNIDGTEQSVLINEKEAFEMPYINIVDDWIYYEVYAPSNRHIYRVYKDGSDRQLVASAN